MKRILRYIFHIHDWRLVSNDRYDIIEKDSETMMGHIIGRISVFRVCCSVCNSTMDIKYDEEVN